MGAPRGVLHRIGGASVTRLAGVTRGALQDPAGVLAHPMFILCPNNSGSTVLGQLLARSRGAWSLPTEAQHVPGYRGPQTRDLGGPLTWAAHPKTRAQFEDRSAYDWNAIRKTWAFHAVADHPDPSTIVLRAPPFLLIAETLAALFPTARFIVMLRNPLAAAEGILRRPSRTRDHGAPLERLAGRHLRHCIVRQVANRDRLGDRALFVTYEALCTAPDAISAQIEHFAPELCDLDFRAAVPVKGLYHEPLRDMNDDQIARLLPAQIDVLRQELSPIGDLLSDLGYRIEP